MKKMFGVITIVALLSIGAMAKGSKSQSYDGWISDSKCAAKVKAEGKSDAACAKKCIDGGSPMVLVTDKDKQVLTVANPEALKGHEGHHVNVLGSVKDGKLTVASASMLEDQGSK